MGYKIAIDAGHGSNTAGKRTPDGYREHWANVKVASYFAKAMDRCGVQYIKTGWDDDNSKDDSDTSLTTRQKIIKAAECDYSISFHFNACGDGKSYNSGEGIETLISDKDSCVGDSLKMANCIQQELIKGTKQKNRGVKRQALSMCNCKIMGTKASVLIECGFMTNEYESGLMKTDAFCLECAEEAAKGFCNYLGITYVKSNGSISATTPSVSQPTTPSTAKTYTVQKGDTLSKIGSKTGIAWKTIAELNGIKSPYVVKVGQVLKLTTESSNSSSSSTVSKKYVSNGIDYSLVFDPTYYANKYDDLKKAFGTNADKLFAHFISHGMQEARQAISTFNVTVYKNRYADLRNVYGNNLPLYYQHYIKFGHQEGRSAV